MGYAGIILRVNLFKGKTCATVLSGEHAKNAIGGIHLGMRLLIKAMDRCNYYGLNNLSAEMRQNSRDKPRRK